VREDLTLERFEYRYVIDGTPMTLSGRSDGARLEVTAVTGGRPFEQQYPIAGKLYPSSAINLMPAYLGLKVGAEYAYTVYDGENQKMGEVTQKVLAWETSELFQGPAFKVVTRLHGLETTTWMDELARPLFELAMNGVMISALETEAQAKRYLAAASLNKEEALVEFSRVKPDRPIPRARDVVALGLAIQGLPAGTEFPSGAGQTCAPGAEGMRCEIRAVDPANLPRGGGAATAPDPKLLRPSLNVQSTDPAVGQLTRRILGTERGRLAQVRMLVAWIQDNVKREPVDVFSALDVLAAGRAECQGHAWLYAALARNAGIPTRMVSGLVYSDELGGFLYHSWNESLVDGAWLPVDATFGQVGADATHIRMLEGDTLADMLPLVNWVGRLKIQVGAVEYAAR
ncbi:MAG TPA: transglutaminase-like domain-containing protein, partial [Burkholderiales bacterium]|nr:transglutaminase-like domain-containing protein [Burkholderiales bacterium]